MKTYQITLPDEIAAFVDRVLAEKWDTIDNLFAYAILQVEAELEADADQDIDALRKAVQVGIDQADRGELIDGEIVMKRLRDKLEAARNQPTRSASRIDMLSVVRGVRDITPEMVEE